MALFKARMETAAEYAKLWDDQEQSQAIFSLIKNEYELTVQEILTVCGQSSLLENNAEQQYSLDRREPYLGPLNNIQLQFLRRHRPLQDAGEESPWMDGLLLTINAIAAGMRNTG